MADGLAEIGDSYGSPSQKILTFTSNNNLINKIMMRFYFLLLLLAAGMAGPATYAQQYNTRGILCGDDRVLILEYNPYTYRADTTWSWHAAETKGLPSDYLRRLRTMDEVKPSSTGDSLLLTSSSGAVLLLDRHTKEALFYAACPNAHSAEFLPNNRIAVANSVAEGGNSLEIYDLSMPEKVLFKDTLHSGHGVVWIESRQQLFALGYQELKVYSLSDWDSNQPKLSLDAVHTIPDRSGHDLSWVNDNKLLLTTHHSVFEFDIDAGSFAEYTPLKGVEHVKSVNYDERTGQLLYTKGETSWWTHNVYHLNPDVTIHVPGVRIYKARFF